VLAFDFDLTWFEVRIRYR